MKKFLFILVLMAAAYNANAAEFLVTTGSVKLEGDIVIGDYEKFIIATKNLGPQDTIWLNSTCGSVKPGLDIAGMIRNKHWNTSVAAKDVCTSMCGFIWLAGSPRFSSPNSRIGFHGVFIKDTEQASAGGNAVLGAYLRDLGFSFDTIYYLTQAPADKMEWFNFEAAKKYDIPVVRTND